MTKPPVCFAMASQESHRPKTSPNSNKQAKNCQHSHVDIGTVSAKSMKLGACFPNTYRKNACSRNAVAARKHNRGVGTWLHFLTRRFRNHRFGLESVDVIP